MSAPPTQPELAGQLRRFVVFDASITFASVAFLLVVRATIMSSTNAVVLAGLVALTGTCMLVALIPLRQGRIVTAMHFVAVANWGVALDVTAIAPFSAPVMVNASLLPAALAVPYVPRVVLRRYVAISIAVALGVAAFGTLQDWTDITADMPSWLPDATVVGFTPVMAGLVAITAFHSLAVVRRALDDSMEARDGLMRAQVRMVTAFDEARRSIERDLHDGAQQRLTAVAIGLGRVHARAEREQLPTAAELGELRKDLADARAELRALAHGLYPSSLAAHGLLLALRAQADRCDRPVRVRGQVPDTIPLPASAAVYFCCLEALQNVLVHAGPDATIDIVVGLDDAGLLRFSVADDGVGFDGSRVGAGHGFDNMRDRLGAFGGSLEVGSAPGGGTTVTGWLRLEPLAGTT